MTHTNPPQDMLLASDMMDVCLVTAMHATRAAASRALNYHTPGVLVFQRDMFLDVPLIADIIAITNRRQVVVNESLRKANLSRRTYDHRVNDQILVKAYQPNQLEELFEGSYTITTVHVNRTVTSQQTHNVVERINIRRIKLVRP
jgi:hypothetical protein